MQGRLLKKKYAYPGALIRQGRLIGMGRLFRHLRQPRVKVNKGLQWGNVKQRPFRQIYAYSRIFLLFQVHSVIIRHFQEFFRHIQTYSEPCSTLAYSEPLSIENPYIFRTQNIFKILAFSELEGY